MRPETSFSQSIATIMIMHTVHLERLDLNLLVALRALLAERHVTRAARAVGLTQPAMSHALARLREALGDPLLVRSGAGMVPTARAEAMRAPLERALEDLASAVAPPAPFDPARASRRFHLAASDYVELVMLPALLARVRDEAPGIDLRVTNYDAKTTRDLGDGKLDLAIGFRGATAGASPGLYTQRLFGDRFVCVVREGHPRVGKRLTLDTFLELPHALVSPRGESGGIVDDALALQGKRRRVAAEIPHFLVAPYVIRETDLVLTLAERVARIFVPALGLRQLPPPLELPSFSMVLLWHERQHADPAQRWLRDLVVEVARAL